MDFIQLMYMICYLTDSRIYLTLKYRTTTIFEKEILNMHGCRIYHGQHESLTREFEEIGDFTECVSMSDQHKWATTLDFGTVESHKFEA